MIYLDHQTASSVPDELKTNIVQAWGMPGDASYAPALHYRTMLSQTRHHVASVLRAEQSDAVMFVPAYVHEHLFSYLYHRYALSKNRMRVVVSCRENGFTMHALLRMKQLGMEIVTVGLSKDGSLDIDALANAIDASTAWVSIAAVDAQSGAIFGVDEVASICRMYDAMLHVDATHAIGKIPIDVQTIDADFISFQTHTLLLPPGLGVLYVKHAQQRHVFQELETLFLPFILPMLAALSDAVESCVQTSPLELIDVKQRRDRFESLIDGMNGVHLFLPQRSRIVHTSVFALDGVSSDMAVRVASQEGFMLLGACDHQRRNPYQTPLIDALGLPKTLRHTVLSITLSHHHTDEDIEALASVIEKTILPLRYAA